MADPIVETIQDEKELVVVEGHGCKSPLRSKTIHFNWISGLAVPAIWPFLPKWFTHREGSLDAVVAYFAISNILLRLVSKKVLSFKWKSIWTAKTKIVPAPASSSPTS